MFGAKRKAVEAFGAQFEPHGDAYAYRRNLKAAPVRVSRDELNRFVADYERGYGIVFWGYVAALLLLIFGYVTINFDRPYADDTAPIYLLIAVPSAAFFFAHRWLWNAPGRRLSGRLPVGRPRSAAEARKKAFARMRYGDFAFAAGVAVLLYLNTTGGRDLFLGRNLLWTALLAVALIALGVQAFRKWRLERTSGDVV